MDKSSKTQVLSVFLGDQVFGIPTPKIQDVLRPLQMTTVPLSLPYIKGVSNLRGRIITAIDLRKRINHADNDTHESMNVVIDSNGELYSILVDRVGDVLMLESSEIEDAPLTLNTAWRQVSQGVHQLEKALMVILDTEKIIHNDTL